MKANAPEKIYLFENPVTETPDDRWLTHRSCDSDIEYIRTDAFIEKALKWYCLDCECNGNCKDTKCFFHNEYKRFLEGKENACPPKFEYKILNPDGSTSDNWRHRHFIRKMQDAFIEKACVWISNNCYMPHSTLEDFRKYMEGE